MKTIEERAANLAKEFATGKQNRETAVYRACIRMATEQREIDIVKACQEFCRNCRIHNDMIGNDCECSQLKDFRKALEE